MPSKPILAIGDVHGYLPRLEALLLQEGIVSDCPACDGDGTEKFKEYGSVVPACTPGFCQPCDGTGIARINHDVFVIQMGDLGDFRDEPTADMLAWKFGPEWVDLILWGNHDRAVVDPQIAFGGYQPPLPETEKYMAQAEKDGKLKLAHFEHDFLFTHAGLHRSFKNNIAPEQAKKDPAVFAKWINAWETRSKSKDAISTENKSEFRSFQAIRDAIGRSRYGPAPAGGILWRDADETLYPFQQIFSHSRGEKVRTYQSKFCGDSYCLDVGRHDNGRLAGMWLPEKRVVEVNLNKEPDGK